MDETLRWGWLVALVVVGCAADSGGGESLLPSGPIDALDGLSGGADSAPPAHASSGASGDVGASTAGSGGASGAANAGGGTTTGAGTGGDGGVQADAGPDASAGDGGGSGDSGVPGVARGDCAQPTVRACYPHAEDTWGIGQCASGSQRCEGGEFALWSDCQGAVGPGREICNGLDDDCDGETDELGIESCGLGLCRTSITVCVDGQPQTCEPLDVAEAETCNGLDDDCDGAVDEGVGTGETVRCGLGVCEHTVEGCVQGQPPVCDPLEGAGPEICNGLDDDCDGTVDEGLLNACGECGPAPVERCNGKDDDCDGETDEGLLNACGECGPVPVEQCNGQDDDCDGETDEGLLNACGECGVAPQEVCNGKDDDCDGLIDPGCPCEAVTTGGAADIRHAPVDLILIVDNSASMNDETLWVQEQLQSFADDLAARGLDLRLILFTEQGTGSREVCIAPPLGGPECGNNPAEGFYHIDESISSSLGWHDLEDEVDQWQPLLREGADLHIAMISDDDERWTADEFFEMWQELEPVPPTPTYHAVVAQTECEDAASIGEHHMDLAERTGGVQQDLCEQDIEGALSAIADGIEQVTIACEWPVPDAPDGGELDLSMLTVTVGSAGGTALLTRRGSEGECGDQRGFALRGSTVVLCTSSCASLQGDAAATVEVSAGCRLTGH